MWSRYWQAEPSSAQGYQVARLAQANSSLQRPHARVRRLSPFVLKLIFALIGAGGGGGGGGCVNFAAISVFKKSCIYQIKLHTLLCLARTKKHIFKILLK
jgi:hypothetical protein